MPILEKLFKDRVKRRAAGGPLSGHYVRPATGPSSPIVNDIHSRLNRTRVCRVILPDSIEALQVAILRAKLEGHSISVAGGRHAMGGQQFGTDTVLVDMTAMNRVLRFDPERREIEVQAGIQWPELIAFMVSAQRSQRRQVGIAQKQTGADRLSIGGALAANIHGRGLLFKPIVGDVESFVLIDAGGVARTCSRDENAELFRLAIGGYGIFGIIATVTLRLAPRRKLERVAEILELHALMPAFEKRIADGFLYGDFQYVTDSSSDDFLRKGIFSCYRPLADDVPVPEGQRELSSEDWKELYHLAHVDRKRAFALYSGHYLSTSGQIYWSDTHQLSVYHDDYHRELDRRLGAAVRGSEMITEVYVPRESLADFMESTREDFRGNKVDLIYGTVRLIEKDDEKQSHK